MTIFKLPDLGEGLPDAEISQWHVAVGDVVKKDQILVSMETAKALVEVPSPFAGKVLKLYGKSGDTIKTGAALIEFEGTEGSKKSESKVSEDKGTVAGRLETRDEVIEEPEISVSETSHPTNPIKATPAIRTLAKGLKVDLKSIHPTGENGNITRQDVERMAKIQAEAGPLELLKGVRRAMIQTMMHAHAEVVAVTVVEDAKLLNWREDQDITVAIIQAMIAAQQQEPHLNAWFDSALMGLRVIREMHLGIAMDTTDGLFVPVIHHAEKMDAMALRTRINELKQEVQTRRVAPENLRGASISLSNFGKFTGRYANPVVVPPTVAILGVGRLREEPIAVENEVRICQVLPLSLSFDHRAVNGGEATRYLQAVIQYLEAME